MNLEQIPIVRHVTAIGPDNRVFDGLLTSGPFIILLVIVFGRNVYTLGLTLGYLLVFVIGVAVAAIHQQGSRSDPSNTRN